MTKKTKIFAASVVLALIIVLAWYLTRHTVAVLSPAGPVASSERRLIYITVALGMIVVIPVYIMTAFIALKYRQGNKKPRKYNPTWDHGRALELTWWAIPSVIIAILAVLAWNSAHSLDPFKSLASAQQPLNIKVIALDWKWLFIYPRQNIASVNFFQIPVNTPVNFDITADAPMNSFWIPQLGGQIYAMPGMSTQLHLMATRAGTYQGSSANISGVGFAGMAFSVKAVPSNGFRQWVSQVKKSPATLSFDQYDKLARPNENQPVAYFSSTDQNIYNHTVLKYMVPASQLAPTAGSALNIPEGHDH